ncbi:hypothetical protein [Streptomyces sp. RFCAC02]|uniref:hypothetical protein n=1 Tax=Streptomyces sp. RFCAC02 TaxID=2499143 RepID=UPI001020D887|nr:hypothetical protein [Streptomyces sp. RFCAC02]
MTDRRRSPGPKDEPAEENPFAPPPEGTPDRPWQPRRPEGDDGRDGGDGDGGRDDQRQRWGRQWSDRQPGRGSGRWGDPAGGGGGQGGPPGGPRGWDPSDPGQRHARYALLGGMWGVCAGALLGWEWLGLLLGALALYWGISGLRGGPKGGASKREKKVDALQGRAPAPAQPAAAGRDADRPRTTAAVTGIVLAALSLVIVAASYTFQLVYKDYFDCVDDALTAPSRESCENLLPDRLQPLFGENR